MPVPYLGDALNGWVKKSYVTIITQTVVNHETVETESIKTYPANFQPMPAEKVNRKPEEQRTWKWWSIIIQDKTVVLKTDDKIKDSYGKVFRVESVNDWRESGFTSYEAVEDYTA